MSRLEECKKTDIVSFLSKEGYHPVKQGGGKAWFLSPLHQESNPSFVVFLNSNRWIDYGKSMLTNDIIDLVCEMNKCTKAEAINVIMGEKDLDKFEAVEVSSEPLISVTRTLDHYISPLLLLYLKERCISPEVYNRFTKQTFYSFKDNSEKEYHAVGMRNDKGGYEVRNKFHKYCISPKYPTTYINDSHSCSIFEGMFDMLSAVEYFGEDLFQTDVIILNGLGLIGTMIDRISRYKIVNIYLDKGIGAENTISYIKSRMYEGIVLDHRYLYGDCSKDFSEFWCNLNKEK